MFLRTTAFSLREAAWTLNLCSSLLSDWNQYFDEHMKPLKRPDGRGKSFKVSIEMVRVIVKVAEALKSQGKRIRLQRFTKQLRAEHGIDLSRKKMKQVLIANDLFAARTRRKRPQFYQSLRKAIPNGLVSLDGSEMTVWLDEEPYTFNVELSVDVKTFTHTAFSIADSETSEEVIEVLEAHRKKWGNPLGIVCDHGSSNLSEKTLAYLREHDIELVAVGPSNPKGNGTDEGAFSHMKQILATIHLDSSSPKTLARCVLEKIISVYISMRNRLSTRGGKQTPIEGMAETSSEDQRRAEKQKLRSHIEARKKRDGDQDKVDRLHAITQYLGMEVEPLALRRAEKTIKAYEMQSIGKSEEAFIKAVNRKPERMNLSYFFGILRNIQQERDDEACTAYCHRRYNQQIMEHLQRQQKEAQQPEHCVENVIAILISAIKATIPVVKKLAIKKARQWTDELMKSYSYPEALKKRFSDALGNLTEVSLDQKNKVWELIQQFLNPKSTPESVTLFS